MFKKIVVCFIALLFIGCLSSQKFESPNKDSIDVKIQTKYKDVKESKEKFITITDSKTKKTWQMSYDEWETMTQSYQYWTQVSKQPPKISEIIDDGQYLYIIFNYYDKNNNKVGFKINKNDNSILSGKVLVPKNYLVNIDKSKQTIYKGVIAGTVVYSILITILIIILAL